MRMPGSLPRLGSLRQKSNAIGWSRAVKSRAARTPPLPKAALRTSNADFVAVNQGLGTTLSQQSTTGDQEDTLTGFRGESTQFWRHTMENHESPYTSKIEDIGIEASPIMRSQYMTTKPV